MDEDKAKDRLLLAILPNVPFDGWSLAAIRAGARSLEMSQAEAMALFPRAGAELIAAFSRWADRAMLERLAATDLASLRVPERIATAVRTRFTILEPHREAVRRSLALLALPLNAALGLRLLYETVDAIWYAAGDTATDYNFYTKRALLAGVLTATTLYWLDDRSLGGADTAAFLERRLADVAQLPKLGQRLRELGDRLPNPLRFLRAAQRR